MATTPRPAWVLGSSGLLGTAVTRTLREQDRHVHTAQIPWQEPEAAVARLLAEAALVPEGTDVFWCAGAGVVGTSQEALDAELSVLGGFLEAWHPRDSAFFFASSAGGVYAGSAAPPFTEETAPVPLAPYGHAKISAEQLTREFSTRTGVPVLAARISNLYGPGQDISKPQGLVSQLCRAQLTRQPLSVYVSLDTMRDYLYVDDAARMSVAALDAVVGTTGVHVKILASERSTTIASILGDLHRLSRRRPPVVLGTSGNARFQVRDLRLRSVAWPSTTEFVRTPLAAGMAATLLSVGEQLRVGTLTR